MCGRIVWVWDAKTGMLVRRFDERALDDPKIKHVLEKKRYNVPPASHLPIVKGTKEGPRIDVARWGFPIPKRPNGVFNTRIETSFDSPMWRGMMGKTQALFMAKGFYEWKRDGKRRQPFFIFRDDGEPMLFAGVYGYRTVDGASALCGSIVTCAPNEAMADLHDRMPVVLEAHDADRWLAARTKQEVQELAVPAGDVLQMHAVTADVNSTDNDRPDLMEPAAQKHLF